MQSQDISLGSSPSAPAVPGVHKGRVHGAPTVPGAHGAPAMMLGVPPGYAPTRAPSPYGVASAPPSYPHMPSMGFSGYEVSGI